MNIPDPIRSTRRLALGLALVGFLAGPALAQAAAAVPCTVRIRPRAAADYDPSTEVLLRGRIIGRENGLILLRMAAGTVHVDAGAWGEPGWPDTASTIEILASRRQEDGHQRFLAREIRQAGSSVMIRDARGVLVH